MRCCLVAPMRYPINATLTADLTMIMKASTPATIESQGQAMPQVEAVQPTPQPATPGPAAVVPIILPPLAEAFAALLAAEQTQPTPTGAPTWPTPPQPLTIDTADLVEQVTRRVLERLTDRVVRETVADIVSSIAERAVREEIERIKASIK